MSRAHVYLICELHSQNSTEAVPFKIGISGNPIARVHDLNAGNARVLHLHFVSSPMERWDALELERGAHEELESWALGREWFHCPIEYGLDALRSVGALVE